MTTPETIPSEYGNISLMNEASLSKQGVLFLGGWDQNFSLMQRFQVSLAETAGLSSIGFSAFDVIDPLDDEPLAEDTVATLNQDFIDSLPTRLIKRAIIVTEMTRSMMRNMIDTPVVLTHCAGANVLLVANLLQIKSGRQPILPTTGLLAEPMISEGQKALRMAKVFSEAEKRAQENPEAYISLQGLRSETAQDLGMQAAKPMGDILNSRGVHLFRDAREAGLSYTMVLGQEDIAAPAEKIIEQLASINVHDGYTMYPEQCRLGHGYLLAEPDESSKYVAAYFDSL